MMEKKGLRIFGNDYAKLTVLNTRTNEELAVITECEITTASDEIVVKLTPNNED